MKKKLPFFIALLCFCFKVYGQFYNQQPDFLNANSIWLFGTSAGLNFNLNPSAITSPSLTALAAIEGRASVADPVTGQLLFYTDGERCWNRNHVVMPNGSGLYGNGSGLSSTTQGACIVAVKNQPGKYYLFSLDGANSNSTLSTVNGKLFYSIVDMSLDGGFGDIAAGQKNLMLDDDILSEAMIAVPGNNCDVWLLVHAFPDPVFKAYHITSAGVDPTPVVSTVGAQIQGSLLSPGWGPYMMGGMTISPNRQTLAMVSYVPLCMTGPVDSLAGVLLFHFDPATGIVSDELQVEENLVSYVVAFSPDNTKLYMANYDLVSGNIDLRQYDISTYNAAAIAASMQVIVPTLLTGEGTYLRLYNDTIYVNLSGQTSLGRIVQPNLAGPACGYQANAVPLAPGTNSGISLPNEAIFFPPGDTTGVWALDTLICSRNDEPFAGLTLSAEPGFNGYIWNDGITTASRTITQPGKYWVLSKDSCHSRADTFRVRYANVTFSLGPDTVLCDKISYELKVSLPGVSCLWSDGSTGNTYTATGKSTVWVKVSANGCEVSDTVKVSAQNFKQDLGKDMIFCKEVPISVELQANVPEGATAFWNDGSNAAAVVVKDTGMYWVTVKDEHCEAADTIGIRREACDCFSHVASAFSPNGDGINDVFIPVIETGCSIGSYTFNVYNRYGQRIFSSAAAAKGWDGTFNGQPVDAGTYMFDLRFEGGTRKQQYYKKGDVTLIR
jgi:gliding motility-associated-like protein